LAVRNQRQKQPFPFKMALDFQIMCSIIKSGRGANFGVLPACGWQNTKKIQFPALRRGPGVVK
jgi:hypothetical protein